VNAAGLPACAAASVRVAAFRLVPAKYCLRHRDNRDETLTTLEDFVYRKAG
jgi:hypothetical protein